MTAVCGLLGPNIDVSLLVDKRLPAARLHVKEFPLSSIGPAFVWLQTAAPAWLARHQVDVFHCPWYGLPYWLPTAGIATIHDLTFEHRPDWFTKRRARAFQVVARRAAKTARFIIAPSEFVLDDIVATYGVSRDRLVMIPNAVETTFQPSAAHSHQLPPEYLVVVGGAQRRRVDLAVEAWRVAKTGAELVIVGEPGIASGGGIHSISAPPDNEWAGILAGARALIYPTEYEGFGLPALEAAASGTPTVAARVGALPEVMGDAAVWADSLTVNDLARAIGQVDDQAATRALDHAGKSPTWSDVAAKLAATYIRAAS